MTMEQAMEMVGWQDDSQEGVNFKDDFLFKDRYGNKVRCEHIQKQRHFDNALALRWMYEILGVDGEGVKYWEINGEPIILGQTGLILDGQHRLIGFIWACQEYAIYEDYGYLDGEPVLETFVNVGIREDIRVINTLNTCKPRSLGDAIYATGLFNAESSNRSDRKKVDKLSKLTEGCMKVLWDRIGAGFEQYGAYVSHQAYLDFMQRHPTVLECVEHIFTEDGKEKKIGTYLGTGNASALCYLMAASKSVRENDGEGYAEVDAPSEEQVDFTNKDKALDFWVNIAAKNPKLDGVRTALSKLYEPDVTGDQEGDDERRRVSLAERIAVICKAWKLYASNKTINCKDCKGTGKKGTHQRCPSCLGWGSKHLVLKFVEGKLAETPTVGGLDLGEVEYDAD